MSKKIEIAASLLSADFSCLGQQCQDLIAAGVDRFHIDVMDHHYVENFTFGPMICEHLQRFGLKAPMDVHLMVQPAEPLIKLALQQGATSIAFHPKTVTHPLNCLKHIQQESCQAALALNPDEPIEDIIPYFDHCDYLLIMSVHPGFGGQSFLKESISKIKQLKTELHKHKASCKIMVDGGINADNAREISAAGADILVAGSGLFSFPPYTEQLKKLRP
jgi:ribulose-phosphate 3-epimerase